MDSKGVASTSAAIVGIVLVGLLLDRATTEPPAPRPAGIDRAVSAEVGAETGPPLDSLPPLVPSVRRAVLSSSTTPPRTAAVSAPHPSSTVPVVIPIAAGQRRRQIIRFHCGALHWAVDATPETESITVRIAAGASRLVARGYLYESPVTPEHVLWTWATNVAVNRSMGIQSASAAASVRDIMIVRYSHTAEYQSTYERDQRAANAARRGESILLVIRKGGHFNHWIDSRERLLASAVARKPYTDDLRMPDADFVAALNGAR